MDSSVRRVGLVLASAGLLVVIDTTVTVVALPAIVADLDTSLPVGSWTTTGYVLGLIAVIPLSGWLTGRFGDRRVYLIGLGVFVLAAVLAGFSPTIGVLIGLRILQGLGGGVINPVGFAIALRAAGRGEKGRMMSFLGLPVLVGPALGPPLAGLLVDATTWRWLFWSTLVLGGIVIIVCYRFLPAASPHRSHLPPDVLGAVLIVAGSTLLVLACTRVGEDGRITPATGLVLVLAGGAFAGFVVRSRRIAAPLIGLAVLAHPATRWGLGVMALFTAGYFGFAQVLPAYVQGVRGDSVFTAGLLMIPVGLGVGLTLQIATRLVDRVEPDRVIAVGVVTALAGLLAVAAALAAGAAYPVVGAAAVVVGVGSGATLMPTNVFITRDLTGAEVPAATTLLTLVSQLGTAVGTAAVASAITVSVGWQSPALGDAETGGLAAMVRLGEEERDVLESDLALAVGQSVLVPAACVAAVVLVHVSGMIARRRVTGSAAPTSARSGPARP